MDIRKARPPKGTLQPEHLAEENKESLHADISDSGAPELTDIDQFGGDLVIKGYVDFLKANDISEEDIKAVQDSLLTSGAVSWSFSLFDKIPVEFSVRRAWADDYIAQELDRLSNEAAKVSNVRFSNLVAECNLAASLSRYGDERYRINGPEDMASARERVRALAYVVQNALVRKLAVFDRVLAVATSDWAVRNFISAPKAS